MAITLVQQVFAEVVAGSTATAVIAEPTPGNLLVVAVRCSIGVTVTVSDNGSGSWSDGVSATGSTTKLPMFYQPNCVNGITSVSVAFTPDDTASIMVYEFSGVKTTSPLDQTGSLNSLGSTSAPVSPTLTPSVANELFITALDPTDIAITGCTAPFTYIGENNVIIVNGAYRIDIGYLVASDSSPQTCAYTPTTAQHYVSTMMSFEPAASETNTTTMFLSM